MFKNIIAGLLAFFTHPLTSVPAAAQKIEQVSAGITSATQVVQSLPEGNTKTAALDALEHAGTLAAQAVSYAHTAEAVVAIAQSIKSGS